MPYSLLNFQNYFNQKYLTGVLSQAANCFLNHYEHVYLILYQRCEKYLNSIMVLTQGLMVSISFFEIYYFLQNFLLVCYKLFQTIFTTIIKHFIFVIITISTFKWYRKITRCMFVYFHRKTFFRIVSTRINLF